MSIGEYTDLRQVGAGSFGITYRAKHRESGDIVALKKLAIRDLEDWKPLERFEREAKVLRSLRHPGVVRFIDAFEAQDEGAPVFYIVSEFVEGPTLAEQISKGDRWDDAQAVELLASLLETLEYLHGLSPRVVHRDIKPGNIVMKDGQRPVLVDFGSVSDLLPPTDGGLTIAGTAGYMAPEQAMGAVDPRSDLFGVGATLLHALSHTHPSTFPRDGVELDLGSQLGCSVTLQRVLKRLLAFDPSTRFQSAADARAELRQEPPNEGSDASRAVATTGVTALVPAEPRPLTPKVRQVINVTRSLSTLGQSRIFITATVGMVACFFLMQILPAPYGVVMGLLAQLGMFLGGSLWVRSNVRGRYGYGTVVEGAIEHIASVRNGTVVQYNYTIEGQTHRGRFSTTDLLAVREVSRGDAVVVFCEPGAPGQHTAMLPGELDRADEA